MPLRWRWPMGGAARCADGRAADGRRSNFDGKLLVTQQDALLMGGKVQAMPGFADHVVFRDAGLCVACVEKTCVAMCSGQALTRGDGACS